MPKINRVEKSVSSISLTREAWAILHQKSLGAGLSKSEYLENLIRHANMSIYDLVREYLIEHYKLTNNEIESLRKDFKTSLETIEAKNESIKEFLLLIGVSPNQIP